MRAIVQSGYGAAEDVLELQEVDEPLAGDGDVLVRVQAASVNAADWHLMRGTPWLVRLAYGLRRPKIKTLGADIAGVVESVGKDVKTFRPGDEVIGDLSAHGFGGFAEYAAVPEEALVLKPTNTTFVEAAAVPMAAVTALQALRDHGRVQPGQKILINGASGGVGTFGVQIAKALGAEVTGVCSTRNLELVRSLGADAVVDYTEEDPTKNGRRYDLIVDAAAHRPFSDHRSILGPKGVYVMVGGSTGPMFQAMLLGPLVSRAGGQRIRSMLAKPNQRDLGTVNDLIEAGKVFPVVDRRYPLHRVPEAVAYVEAGHTQGKTIITM